MPLFSSLQFNHSVTRHSSFSVSVRQQHSLKTSMFPLLSKNTGMFINRYVMSMFVLTTRNQGYMPMQKNLSEADISGAVQRVRYTEVSPMYNYRTS